jgi:type IV secretory pathway component VirB8
VVSAAGLEVVLVVVVVVLLVPLLLLEPLVVAVNPAGGFIEIATIIIVDVSADIKVITVITQLHIWQFPVVRHSILYSHKRTSGKVTKEYIKYETKPHIPVIIKKHIKFIIVVMHIIIKNALACVDKLNISISIL